MWTAKEYYEYVTAEFQGFAYWNLEDSQLFHAIHDTFKDWTQYQWTAINDITWGTIKRCCIPRGIWIDHLTSKSSASEMMVRLVWTRYDANLKDWDLERIRWVEEIYGQVSRGIQLRKQELLMQQAQDPRFIQHPPTRISNPVPPTSMFRRKQALSIQAQPAPTRISNPAPPTSKFRKDCECIPERSTALTLSTQVLPIQVPVPQAPQAPIQAPPAQVQASPTQRPPAQGPAMQVPPMQTPSIQAPLAQVPSVQVSLVPAPPRQAPSVQAPSVQATMAQELPVQAPPVLAAPVQVPPEQVPLVHAPLAQVPPIQAPGAGILEKEASKSVTPAKETVTPDKDVTSEEVPSSTQVFNSCFVNEIKDPRIEMNFHIRPPLKTLSLTGISSDSVVKLTSYHPHYKEIPGMRKCAPFLRPFSQLSSLPVDLPDYVGKFASYRPHYKEKLGMTESAYHPFLLRPPPNLTDSAHDSSLLRSPQKLLSLPGVSSDCIVEVMKPLHDVPKASTNQFATYNPHYKDKLVSNPTRTFICAANSLRFLCNWGNLSVASLLTYNDDDNIKFYLRNISQACVEIAPDINQDFYIRLPRELMSLLGNSSDSIVKTIKPLHDVPEASTNRFAIYHPHYKDKFSNQTRSFVFAADNVHSLCSLSNLSTALPALLNQA